MIQSFDTRSACAVLLCSLSVGHIAPPRVFQIPQVLVKLKKYPQGDKVRLGGPWSCRQRRVRADGDCPDRAGARPKLGEGGWGGKKGQGGKGRLVRSPLCTAGFHRGCELRLRVPAEADPAARHGRSAMQVSACVPWARWQHCEPVASLSPAPPTPFCPQHRRGELRSGLLGRLRARLFLVEDKRLHCCSASFFPRLWCCQMSKAASV